MARKRSKPKDVPLSDLKWKNPKKKPNLVTTLTRKWSRHFRTKRDQRIKRIEAEIKKDKLPFLGWTTEELARSPGKVYVSEQLAKNWMAGTPLIAESLRIWVEDIDFKARTVTLSVKTEDKGGRWLTRMYCGDIAVNNSVTIVPFPRLFNLILGGHEQGTATPRPDWLPPATR